MTDEKIFARVRAFERLFVKHPRIMAAEKAIYDLSRRQQTMEPLADDIFGDSSPHLFDFSELSAPSDVLDSTVTQYCALVVGDSGAGKTRLVEHLAVQDQYRGKWGGLDGDIVPLLRLDVPNNPTPKSLLQEVCGAANVKIAHKMTRNELARQLRHKLTELKTRVVIADEAHVLVEHMSDKAISSMARCIKFLLNICGVPFVFLGEGPLRDLNSYPALKRRIDACICIEPYSWSDEDERFDFLNYLDQLDYGLGFSRISGFALDDDIASRLYFVSGGHIGQVSKYLSKALIIALLEDATKVTRQHLARVYAEFNIERRPVADDPDVVLTEAPRTYNPFRVDREEFKAMWKATFTDTVSSDVSRVVKRKRESKNPKNAFAR